MDLILPPEIAYLPYGTPGKGSMTVWIGGVAGNEPGRMQIVEGDPGLPVDDGRSDERVIEEERIPGAETDGQGFMIPVFRIELQQPAGSFVERYFDHVRHQLVRVEGQIEHTLANVAFASEDDRAHGRGSGAVLLCHSDASQKVESIVDPVLDKIFCAVPPDDAPLVDGDVFLESFDGACRSAPVNEQGVGVLFYSNRIKDIVLIKDIEELLVGGDDQRIR